MLRVVEALLLTDAIMATLDIILFTVLAFQTGTAGAVPSVAPVPVPTAAPLPFTSVFPVRFLAAGTARVG